MLKLNASYSKKVPGDQEFSSQGYLCSVELELSDNLEPRELQQRIHDTFALVKESVEAELSPDRSPAPKEYPQARSNAPQARNGHNGGQPASNKQLHFITSLASQRGVSINELNAQVASRYSVNDIYGLTKRQASQLVDELKAA